MSVTAEKRRQGPTEKGGLVLMWAQTEVCVGTRESCQWKMALGRVQ